MICHMWTVWYEASSVFSSALWSCWEVLLGKPRPIPRDEEPCTVSSELRPGLLLSLLPNTIRLLFLFASCSTLFMVLHFRVTHLAWYG